MKRIWILLLMIMFIVFSIGTMGCSKAMVERLFPEPAPLCTVEEQADSVIYQLLNKINANPSSADFTLLMTSASQFKKHKGYAAEVIEVATGLKDAINKGITYAAFEAEIKKQLDPMQYVVASKFVKNFGTYHIPIKPCDKRLIVAHLDNQMELATMALE